MEILRFSQCFKIAIYDNKALACIAIGILSRYHSIIIGNKYIAQRSKRFVANYKSISLEVLLLRFKLVYDAVKVFAMKMLLHFTDDVLRGQ